MREMNHKNPRGSRTGDIVVILDSREGYLAVNYAEEEYPGWHGGPTVAESNVPMMFAMPGTLFNSSSGETVEIPEALSRGFGNGVNSLLGMGSNSEIQLRNWHFGRILKGIVTEFRE